LGIGEEGEGEAPGMASIVSNDSFRCALGFAQSKAGGLPCPQRQGFDGVDG